MTRNEIESGVSRVAQRVLQEREVRELPVDPKAIARSSDIAVWAKHSDVQGVSGMLLRLGNKFGIIYSTHINNRGFENFSIAHELGHYFLPGHMDAVLADGGIHKSRRGLRAGSRYELEADIFAASLLMPHRMFSEAMRGAGEGLQAIEQLSAACQTSLTATAIRYVRFTRALMAIVVSTGNEINFCFVSKALKEALGLRRVRKGDVLPKATVTFALNRDRHSILHTGRAEATSELQTWFGGKSKLVVTEQVMGLGRYGKRLTVLTVPGVGNN